MALSIDPAPLLLALAREAAQASSLERSLLRPGYGANALFDTAKDDELSRLGTFAEAVAAIEAYQPILDAGASLEARRIVLQYVYDYVSKQSGSDFEQEAFDDTWRSFSDELGRSEWRYLAMCYLQNFVSDEDELVVADGVTIHKRGSYDFQRDSWSNLALKMLHENWSGSPAEMHVLVVEDQAAKSADNFILGSSGLQFAKLQRVLRALRLTKEGDVTLGGGGFVNRILTTRPVGSGFPPNSGATMSGASSGWQFGSTYSLFAEDVVGVRNVYDQLRRIEPLLHGHSYNHGLALQFFESTYDRFPPRNDTRIVDLVTAAEALVGSGSKRASSRVAGIVANDDNELRMMVSELKGFYRLRNAIVHGDSADSVALARYEVFRTYIRRLLCAFIYLAVSANPSYPSEYFRQNRFDIDLESSTARAALRRSMGLE